MTPEPFDAFKFLGMHLACGLAAALVFGTAVLYLDIGHIRTMALEAHSGGMIFSLMYFGLFVSFGSIAMAVGIMGLGNFSEENRYLRDDDDKPSERRPASKRNSD